MKFTNYFGKGWKIDETRTTRQDIDVIEDHDDDDDDDDDETTEDESIEIIDDSDSEDSLEPIRGLLEKW